MEAPCLAVARFQKPHGLKGEAIVFVLTDEPEMVFVPGRELLPLDDDGRPTGTPLVLERGRAYHRRWLLKFAHLDRREDVEGLRDVALGVPVEQLKPIRNDEMYAHEIPGAEVVANGAVIGTARELVATPAGDVLVVDGREREHLIPFRPPILVGLSRERRVIEIDPPAGLLDL